MNIDFGIRQDRKRIIGLWAERLGIAIFLLTFWMPIGFFLGGDAFFLGHFQPTLEVQFPLFGLGIFLVFFGQYLAKRERVLPLKTILFILIFLGYGAISSIFSFRPEVSMLFLILWTTGFLAMATGEAFVIEGAWKQWTLFGSVLVGFLFSYFFPHLGISQSLLAVASIWGTVFALRDARFSARILPLILYSWVIYMNAQFGVFLFTLLLVFGANLWLPNLKKSVQRRDVLFQFFLLIALFVWGIFAKHFSFALDSLWLDSFLSNPLQILLGVGEGQFLLAIQQFSDTVLVPQALQISSSGLLLTLFEKGIVGLVLLLALVFLPYRISEKKPLLPSILTLFLLLLLPDLIANEQGILLFLPFLFAEKMNGKMLHFAEGK